MTYIISEPFRGSNGDLRVLTKPGLDTFRRYVRQEFPGPPIARLVGLQPTEAGLGKVTFSMPISTWLKDGFGL
jgi:hypothetical protein